jgi:hypothetical protein
LPVVDEIAADYADRVRFVAVAGRASYDKTADRAAGLFSNLEWGLDDAVWDLYNVPYQPVTFLVTGDDIVFDTWPGLRAEEDIRAQLDALVALRP